jgi:hypothetical protein
LYERRRLFFSSLGQIRIACGNLVCADVHIFRTDTDLPDHVDQSHLHFVERAQEAMAISAGDRHNSRKISGGHPLCVPKRHFKVAPKTIAYAAEHDHHD